MNSCLQLVWCSLLFVGSVFESCTGEESWQYMGCFEHNYSLVMKYQHTIPEVDLETCFKHCSYPSTKYMAIELRDDCYCGCDIVEKSAKRDDSLCKYACPDDSGASCGGDNLMSVYLLTDNKTKNSSRSAAPKGKTEAVLRFLVGDNYGVTLHGSSNLRQHDRIMPKLNGIVYTVDYHLSKNYAYALANKGIYRSSLEPMAKFSCELPTLIRSVSGDCVGLAVDWVSDRIYWADCEETSVTIMSCDLSGNNPSRVLVRARRTESSESALIESIVIDPYEQMLFWRAGGVIESCTLSGTNFHPNLTNPKTSFVQTISLDIATHRIYYTVGNSLHKMDYAGTSSTEVFSLAQLNNSLGLEVFKGEAYWTNLNRPHNNLYKANLNFTSLEQVRWLKDLTSMTTVWDIRLVHPELQTYPSDIPCIYKGCSHYCFVVTVPAPKAYCLCPKGFLLTNNETTCIQYPKNGGPPKHGRSTTEFLIVVLAGAAAFLL